MVLPRGVPALALMVMVMLRVAPGARPLMAKVPLSDLRG